MATITFYQKPGCKTNVRQRQMLEAAGHVVVAKSLLTEPWTAERLREFFGSMPVASWFNAAAPRIKSGEIDPARFDAESALDALVRDPLLIRRPLVEADGERCAGFDRAPITSLLGAAAGPDAESCSRPEPAPRCPDPEPAPESSSR